MPALSTFYGITIKMYFRQSEHNPPHVHAEYSGHRAVIDINTFRTLEGELPTRAMSLVMEWMSTNRDKLLEIWDTQNFEKIDPLP